MEHTCVEKKGKLIIPAFSVGKTQEVLYTLNELSNAGELPRIPVFVDSPWPSTPPRWCATTRALPQGGAGETAGGP